MDALVEPKDYMTLSYHAIHAVEVLRCSLLQPLTGSGELFAKIAIRLISVSQTFHPGRPKVAY